MIFQAGFGCSITRLIMGIMGWSRCEPSSPPERVRRESAPALDITTVQGHSPVEEYLTIYYIHIYIYTMMEATRGSVLVIKSFSSFWYDLTPADCCRNCASGIRTLQLLKLLTSPHESISSIIISLSASITICPAPPIPLNHNIKLYIYIYMYMCIWSSLFICVYTIWLFNSSPWKIIIFNR